MQIFIQLLAAIAPVVVAVVTIIPTILANHKKTQESIKAANKATDERLAKVEGKIDSVTKEIESNDTRNRRYHILRFYDEICAGTRHSESHFEDILDDIDAYERYCKAHPDFVNNRGEVAMARIKEVYAKVKANGGFLKHDDE